MSSRDIQPEGETPARDGGEARGAVLGVSWGDAPPPLAHQEGRFEHGAPFSEVFVGRAVGCSVVLWRDDGVPAPPSRLRTNGIGIRARVRQQLLRGDPLDQRAGRCARRAGPFGRNPSARPPTRLHGQLSRGGEPPGVRLMS